MSKKSLVTIRLYRNLLRTARPFTGPSPNAAVLTSLLHRSGVDDHIRDWNAFVAQNDKHDDENHQHHRARDLSQSYSSTTRANDNSRNNNKTNNNRTYQRLFRRLLREVVTGTNGYGKMVFPSQVDTSRLKSVIQREFRARNSNNDDSNNHAYGRAASSYFDQDTRQKVAFAALRELHKKLSYYDWLSKNNPKPIPQQAAKRVSPLPIHPPASYLRPGVFLVSHPYMHDSYFSKSVICILEHKGLGNSSSKTKENNVNDNDDNDSKNSLRNSRQAPPGQSYGVIVNRVSLRTDTGENRTLKEIFREYMLPERLTDVFGDSVVREGGPVHVALQMIHSLPADDSVEDVGGSVIPFVSEGADDSPALYSDRATYFQGNMFKTVSRVEKGTMDRGR